MGTKAILFDRDGVINPLVQREDGRLTSPWHKDELTYFPYVKETFAELKELGFVSFIVTNQPGIVDGDMTVEDLADINLMLYADLDVTRIDCATYKQSEYYKPENMMLEDIIETYNVDRFSSYMIGDRWKDIVPGNKSGLTTILVGEPNKYQYELQKQFGQNIPSNTTPNYYADNIREAWHLILFNYKRGEHNERF